MKQQTIQIRLAILLLFLATCLASSLEHGKEDIPNTEDGATNESKIKPRYSHGYILEEDDHYAHGPKEEGAKAGEYFDSEDAKAEKEQEEAQGDENLDKSVKKDEYDDHLEKAGDYGFKAGGVAFDKHLKDRKADNKEVENVKQHDVGMKYGGEAVKEHKLGKHKEKSKGHKLHGFKNVYHKEEYGDHKTFHDEFLDTDHQHNYDDQHEHKEMQGGKFSKGFKHEGENKNYDKGDEKHQWGKGEFDAQVEGKREKGGQSSKHRHTAKKRQGHYQADAKRNKNSVHKKKKGSPTEYVPHSGHHGPHQAEVEPMYYGSHKPHHHHHVHVPSHHHKQPQVHHIHHQTHFDDDHGSYEEHGGYKAHDSSKDDEDLDHSVHSHSTSDDDDDSFYHSNDSSEEDDSRYQGRSAPKPQNRLVAKGKKGMVKQNKHKPKPEAVQDKPLEKPQYRQPLVYVERFKTPEYSRPEKYLTPIHEKFQKTNDRIHYGHEPLKTHHHHNQRQHHFARHPVFDHTHHPFHHRNHHHSNKHIFPKLSDFDSHYQRPWHHNHKPYFRYAPDATKQEEFKPIVYPHVQPDASTKTVQTDEHPIVPTKQIE